MSFEEQLFEAARSVRERETRLAVVHLAAVRDATPARHRTHLARRLGRITGSLRPRARPVTSGPEIVHASVALD